MRSINQIMADVKSDWKKPYYGAVPYIDALSRCESITDSYGFDDVVSLINYFLANATYWRGAKAREIKKELNDMLKAYKSNPEQFPKGKRIIIYGLV